MSRRVFRAATFFLLALGARSASAQTIDTIAGGFTGDDGPATQAYLFYPGGLARAANGDVYISDSGNARIRRVGADGVITTVVGTGVDGYAGDGGPGTQARLRAPRGLAFDPQGRLYVVDSSNSVIRRWNPATGIVELYAGTPGRYANDGDDGPRTLAAFGGMDAIAVAPNGDIYLPDPGTHRIRVIEAASGLVRAFAGTPEQSGFAGDGGPATLAKFATPTSVAVDAAGNVYVADRYNNRVRKIAAGTRVVTTLAGDGTGNDNDARGDGGPATQARIWEPISVAVRGGDLLIGSLNQRIQRVPLGGGNITTLVGGGGDRSEDAVATDAQLNIPSSIGADGAGNVLWNDEQDGRSRRFLVETGKVRTIAGSMEDAGETVPAGRARIVQPSTVAVDADGNVYIGSYDYRIRRLLKQQGVVESIVGGGFAYQVGVPGNETGISTVRQVTLDGRGGLLFTEAGFAILRRWDIATKIVTLVAGTLYEQDDAGDGGPATQAKFREIDGVAVDAAGAIYVSDRESFKIRKIGADGIIRTVAGNGQNASAGDGLPPLQASFRYPQRLAFDAQGRLLVAEPNRIRRIDFAANRVESVAGNGNAEGDDGEGGPATQAVVNDAEAVAVGPDGRVYFTDEGFSTVREIGLDGRVRTVVKPYEYAFFGDGGPATAAAVFGPQGLAVASNGAIVFADRNNNRVRRIGACVALGTFSISGTKADGAGTVTLSWSAASDAFTYDLYLDTVNPPVRKVASDLAATSFQASSLTPGTTYYAQVEARGDPYCASVATRRTSVTSFSTASICAAPGGFTRSGPADGATGVNPAATLSWGASAGAAGYDVYLGASDPPAFLRNVTTTSTTTPALVAGSRYYWRVVALASCDPAKTSSTTTGNFVVAGACAAPSAFAASSPAGGASGQPLVVTLAWQASAGGATYDLYFGPGSSPPLLASGLGGTSYRIAGLSTGTSYSWRVVARAGCNASLTTTTATVSFTTSATCATPSAPAVSMPTGTLQAGQSYVLSWTASEGVDAATGGYYRVERSLDAGFGTILDAIDTAGRSASFTYDAVGTVHHRVRAFSGCGTSTPATVSGSPALTFALGRPRVVIARQPQPSIVPVNGFLGTAKTTFDVKNVSNVDFIGAFNTIQPIPFFRPTELTIALRAGETKTYTLEYTGVPVDKAGRWEGLVLVTSLGADALDLVPYATVALTITAEQTGAAPAFGAEAIAFAPTAATADPPPVTVTIRNPGTSPMQLSGEVGPEVWLTPDADWNRTPLQAGETRTITLRCQRVFGAAGGVFPRYTYFTVRTREGASARLLVRDEVPPESNLCASRTRLPAGAPSLVVPSIVNAPGVNTQFVSKLSIGNLGSDEAVVDLFYTPDGANGFDCASVLAKRLTLGAGDVLALTDPLGVLFGAGGSGQLEVRSGRLAQLKVNGAVEAPAPNGGAFGFAMPAFPRGAGATVGRAHVIPGLTVTDRYRTNIILAETTGDDTTTVRVTLYGADGSVVGAPLVRPVPPYGKTQFRVADLAGAASVPAGSARLEITSGVGAVQALATVIDNLTGDASTYLGRAEDAALVASATLRSGTRALWARPPGPNAGPAFVVPSSAYGYSSVRGTSFVFQTSLTLSNVTAQPATMNLTYRPSEPERAGTVRTASVVVPGRGTRSYENALVELFGFTASDRTNGPITIEGDTSRSVVAARVFSVTDQGTLGDALPVVPVTTENATGARNAVTLETEGLEHSIDLLRGARSNLILTEVLGREASVVVELWEKGDRRVPILRQVVGLHALEKVQLSTVFQSEASRKDRTNVRLTVRAEPGSEGKVVAFTTKVDNITGDTKNALMSAVGESTGGSTIGF